MFKVKRMNTRIKFYHCHFDLNPRKIPEYDINLKVNVIYVLNVTVLVFIMQFVVNNQVKNGPSTVIECKFGKSWLVDSETCANM